MTTLALSEFGPHFTANKVEINFHNDEVKQGAVHTSSDIYLTAEENPE